MPQLLIADRAPSTHGFVSQVVQPAGWRIASAFSGEQARDLLSTGVYKAVLADVELYDMPALSLLEYVRLDVTRFVVMLGPGSRAGVVSSLQAGAHDYLEKPLRAHQLLAALPPCARPTGGRRGSDTVVEAAVLTYRGAHHVAYALDIIRARHAERDLSVAEVAEQVGVRFEYLCRLCKAHTGRTLLDHLHRARTDHAARLLRMTSLSMLDVARACGYDTTRALDRCFARLRGRAPTDLRGGLRHDGTWTELS